MRVGKNEAEKCQFFTNHIDYLDHIINLAFSSQSVAGIGSLQTPSTITEFCSFFGLCNVFHSSVQNSARIAAPLNYNSQLGNDQPRLYIDLISRGA